jgi:hypothetical protein
MKTWAIFYHTFNGVLQEACGDRAVLCIDGRLRKSNAFLVALDWGRKHGWDAFHLERADRLPSNGNKKGRVWMVTQGEVSS